MATTLKHKVTLRTKIAETPASNGNEEPRKDGNQKRKGIVTLSVIVVVLAIITAFILLTNHGSDNNDVMITATQDSVEIITNDVIEKIESTDASITSETSAEQSVTTESPDSEDTSVEKMSAAESAIETSDIVSSHETKNEVQASVLSGSLEDKARQVIRGNFGNGAERRKRLGSEYTEIQNKVNEMYREGLVR